MWRERIDKATTLRGITAAVQLFSQSLKITLIDFEDLQFKTIPFCCVHPVRIPSIVTTQRKLETFKVTEEDSCRGEKKVKKSSGDFSLWKLCFCFTPNWLRQKETLWHGAACHRGAVQLANWEASRCQVQSFPAKIQLMCLKHDLQDSSSPLLRFH